MILSVLIPTLEEEKPFLDNLLKSIYTQVDILELDSQVEVLTDHRDRSVKTGTKRNDLLQRASGEYVWFVDTDDYIYPYAIGEIVKKTLLKPDVIGINGIMTTDGTNQVGWEIRLEHPYIKTIRDGKDFYLRYPNHITPMKREHALRIGFPNKTFAEDYDFAVRLKDSGLLKTQEIIIPPVYHYKFRTNK